MKKCVLAVIVLCLGLLFTACAHLPIPTPGTRQANAPVLRPMGQDAQSEWIDLTGPSAESDIDIHQALHDFAASTLIDYYLLLENEELTALAEQWARLKMFIDTVAIRSIRRGIVMDTVVNMVLPPQIYDIENILLYCDAMLDHGILFNVVFSCQSHMQNERLINALLEFTAICREHIRFEVMEELVLGMMPTREALTPSQQSFLCALEDYMAVVNAPFWEDMYNNDPVITHIGLPSAVGQFGSYPFFTIWLYDPDLLGLGSGELAEYTGDMEADIIGFAGDMYAFEFRVNQYGQ